MTDLYNVKELKYITELSDDDLKFCRIAAKTVAEKYGNTFDWRNFALESYIREHRFVICRRGSELVGVMLSRLYPSVFDYNVKILCQDLLYTKPNTRAASALMKDFIDFGRGHANHIITMLTEHSNIKPRSLKRLGFKELETLYRIEV